MSETRHNSEDVEFSLLSGNINDQTVLDDELRRGPFAKGVARLITTTPEGECFVVGIEGAWGEGKSYTIELIRREIEARNKIDRGPHSKWMVFNPWHFTDGEHLASLFLKDLAAFIEQEVGIRPPSKLLWLKQKFKFLKWLCDILIKRKFLIRIILMMLAGLVLLLWIFLDFVNEFTGVSTVAGSAFVWAVFNYLKSQKGEDDMHWALSQVSSLLRDYADALEEHKDTPHSKSLAQMKKDITGRLRQKDLPFSRIVVAVEDLDRLSPQEIRSMVQLMRMVADFPKIVYLVGYDRQHVIAALGDMAGRQAVGREVYAYGEGYLQKVVQAAYRLPHPEDRAIANLTFRNFHRIAAKVYGDDFGLTPYWQSVSGAIAELITSLRMGERIINRSLHMIVMLDKKSNPADVLVASYLMEYQPGVWKWLWAQRNSILSGGRRLTSKGAVSVFGSADRVPDEGFIKDNVEGGLEIKEQVEALLKIVFPSLRYESAYRFADSDRHSFRMGIPEYMEIYYRYEQNPATESPEVFRELLAASSDKARDDVLRKIRAYGAPMLGYVIRDLEEYNRRAPIDWQTTALPLLRSLGVHFDEDSAIAVLLLTVNMINALPEKFRTPALDDIISGWLSDGVKYLPFHLFEKAAMESGFIEYEDGVPRNDYVLELKIEESEFVRLKAKIESQISLWSQGQSNKSFLQHQYAMEMLFMWLRLNPEQARVSINSWIDSDRGIFELLNAMMKTSYSYSEATGSIQIYGLAKYGLKRLLAMDTSAIQLRVNQAASSAPYISKEFPDVIKAVRELPSQLLE